MIHNNIFTVDVEEYYHAENILCSLSEEKIKRLPDRLDVGLNKLLDMLAVNNGRATFFVLGCIAEKNRNLIRRISALGHEIASHGYNHIPLYRHTPVTFEDDLDRSIKILSDVTGERIIGYRATSFSFSSEMTWFSEVLKRHEIIYDSSISPSSFRKYRYEIIEKENHYEIGNGILEFPVSFFKIGPVKIPLGGGYFRAFPYWLIRLGINQVSRINKSLNLFYIHPWELDPKQPRIKLPPVNYLRHYLNLGSTERKLQRLLHDIKYTSIGDFLGIQ